LAIIQSSEVREDKLSSTDFIMQTFPVLAAIKINVTSWLLVLRTVMELGIETGRAKRNKFREKTDR